jgi:hypothetical protein
VHTGLDAIGALEPTPFADGLNGILYGLEGDLGNAGISAVGMLPYLGDTAKLGRHGAKCVAKTIDELSQAGKALDKGGELTKAGRAAQKHGSRPGSAFPPTKGNPSSLNQQGQHALDDILTSPGQTSKPNRFGGKDIQASDGRGARFDANGNFMGFLEP